MLLISRITLVWVTIIFVGISLLEIQLGHAFTRRLLQKNELYQEVMNARYTMKSAHKCVFRTKSLYKSNTRTAGVLKESDEVFERDANVDSNIILHSRNETQSSSPRNASSLFRFGERFSSDGNKFRPPPLVVENNELLLYDTFLILNLCASISVWVVNRNSSPLLHVKDGISEGSLLSVLWIISGLRNGVFLNSAVHGHYSPSAESPRRAGMLALNTFIGTINLRLVILLVNAFLQHKKIEGVELSLELGFGLALMSFWRALHSSYVS